MARKLCLNPAASTSIRWELGRSITAVTLLCGAGSQRKSKEKERFMAKHAAGGTARLWERYGDRKLCPELEDSGRWLSECDTLSTLNLQICSGISNRYSGWHGLTGLCHGLPALLKFYGFPGSFESRFSKGFPLPNAVRLIFSTTNYPLTHTHTHIHTELLVGPEGEIGWNAPANTRNVRQT